MELIKCLNDNTKNAFMFIVGYEKRINKPLLIADCNDKYFIEFADYMNSVQVGKDFIDRYISSIKKLIIELKNSGSVETIPFNINTSNEH